jgi:hypothetical protein
VRFQARANVRARAARELFTVRAFPLGEHAEGERDYASTVRSASLHPRRRRLIVSARDRRGMGRVGGRGSGRVAVSRAARRASSGAAGTDPAVLCEMKPFV